MQLTKEACGQLSDREIVRKSLEEVDYFSCLYDRYEEQLLRYVIRIGLSPEEADDVLQEAFLKVWKNLYAFDTSLKLSSWLYRIVHNEAISCLRKKSSYGKNRTARLDDQYFPGPTDEEREDTLEALEEQDRQTHEILGQLPQKYKEVLVLKFLEGMSYEEISDVLKIPEGTVATRINRAKKKFRDLADKNPSKLNLKQIS